MFSRFFIDRPIFASVISIVITMVGAIALYQLPLAQYPPIAPPTVEVGCNYPGASAQTVAETVAAPIEQQVNGVEDMLYMNSSSTNDGSYALTVTFKPGVDLNLAQVLVQNRVSLAIPSLPEVVRRTGVTTRKRSPDILLTVSINSPDGRYDQLYLSNYARLHLQEELARLPGVSEVRVFGQRDYSMRIWLDPDKLAARGLAVSDVLAAVREQNAEVALGQLGQPPAMSGQMWQFPLTIEGRLQTPEEFGNIVVRTTPDGRMLRVRDIGRVEVAARVEETNNRFNQKPTVGLAIFQLPDANALETADLVKSKMEELSIDFPEGAIYEAGYDTTPFIRESINEVFKSLRDAIILVALVVLIFLQGWRPAIIPLIAVPVAIVGTFAAMAVVGFSLNNLTLFGLVLAIGIVVDDAIVVVEAVEQYIERGFAPRDAAIHAMEDVSGPVIAVGLVLSAVFIPCAFVSGIVGQFFRQFALTIAISTVISTINSLTLSPALAALLLRPRDAKKDLFTRLLDLLFGWFFRLFNFAVLKTINGYTRATARLLRVPLLVLVVYGGLVGLTWFGLNALPTGFIPSQDKGYLVCSVQLPDASSAERTLETLKKVERIALDMPGVRSVNSIAGNSFQLGARASNFCSMFIILEEFSGRKSADTTAGAIQSELLKLYAANIPEATITISPPPAVSGLGRAGGMKLMVEDRGDVGLKVLQEQTDELITEGNSQPQLKGLFSAFNVNAPQLYVDIDRDACIAQGLNLDDVFGTLQGYLGSRYVNDFNMFGRTWQVVVQADAQYRDRPDDVTKLRVRNREGRMVPLGTVASVKTNGGPLMITRYNMYPATSITGNVAPGVSSGEGLRILERIATQTLPSTMAFEWTELAYLESTSGSTGLMLFVFSVVFVFLVLAALYESWSLPLAVILVVPMCVLCSIAGVAFAKMDINVFTQIGFVVLIGLACKNAILIVEFAKLRRDAGEDVYVSILEACRLRLRPILMTSFAFILGVVPLVVADGAGSEMRRALGTAVFSGMLGVTLFGIFLTPVFFLVVDRVSHWLAFSPDRFAGRAGLAGDGCAAPAFPAKTSERDGRVGDSEVAQVRTCDSSSSYAGGCCGIRAGVRVHSMFSRFFIDRPIFATVLSVIITLAGGIAVFTLPITQYPEIAPPTVEVSTMYPGANAKVVADTVAAPIEQQVNGVEDMLYMSSQCTNDGTYTLTVTFASGTDLNLAQVLVQNRVVLAQPTLPDLVQRRGVTVKKKAPGVLMIINLFSPNESRDNLYLSNYATIQLRDELSRVPGVGDISFLGQRDYSMRIWLDPQQMATRNISTQDVLQAIEQQNTQVAAGQIGQQPTTPGQTFQYTMTTLGRLTSEQQFGDIVVRSDSEGRMIRLRDVARIELGAMAYDQVCTLDTQPSIALSVYQLPGSNALETAAEVRARMEELKTRFPDGVDYAIVYDTTPFIRESVREVFNSLRDAVILVAIVVLVFLQSWRPAIIPLVAVPVAIVGTFAAMLAFGFSLNALTLFGLVLAVGIVVDDAIVVVEAVEHNIEQGMGPRDAAIKAMEMVAGPVIAVGLVLSAVFIPCAFITGVVGQFFRQFAVTIAISTVISAFNSLTLSPALAVLLLRPRSHSKQTEVLPRPGLAILGAWLGYAFLGPQIPIWTEQISFLRGVNVSLWPWIAAVICGILIWFAGRIVNRLLSLLFGGFNRGFNRTTNGYVRLVGWLLHGSVAVLLLYGGMIYGTWYLFEVTPTGFIPSQDKGYLVLNVRVADSASLERTQAIIAKIEQLAGNVEGVRHTVALAGQSLLLNANAPNFGSMYVMLDEFHDRVAAHRTADSIADELRQLFQREVQDADINILGAPPIEGLGTAGGFKIVIQDRGDNGLKMLETVSQSIVSDGSEDPRLRDLFASFRADTTWLQLDIDRDAARKMGLSMADIFGSLQINFGSLYVNDFNRFGRTWQVNIQADAKYRMETKDLQQMYVNSTTVGSVPMASFIRIRPVTGPLMIIRHNLYQSAFVNADAAVGASSGEAITALRQVADQNLAPSMRVEYTELAFLQQMAGNTAMYAFLLAVVLVFLVLAAQYESWALPLAVILVVPMCLLCSIVGVITAGMDINIFTQIGFVVLVGLACKNAILIVEYARSRNEEGVSVYTATLDACRLRLRPIIMTSFAFIFGVIPLVLGEGAGAEMRRTLGTAVFAGMLGVTLFGILLTPVFFYVIQRLANWRVSRSG